jgi:transcriptional regulator with XRE-family HTH domain
MVHRGELLKSAIKQSGIPVSRVAEAIGKSRRWLYLQFEKRDVALDMLLRIGKFIHYDFSAEIPELTTKQPYSKNIHDSLTPYPDQDAAFWKDKYLRLLEEYSTLLKKSGL